MSLEGSLKTVALPEVLNLLADTSKTGELHVEGTHAAGRLWFDGGVLSGFQVGHSDQIVDALFDLLRIDDGDFVFDSGAVRADSAHSPEGGLTDIRLPLEQAEARLVEWAEIVAVVPSLEHVVHLIDRAPESGVSLDPDQWSLVVAVGEGRRVGDVLSLRGLAEFDGCKALKGLVDSSLVGVTEPSSPEAQAEVEQLVSPVEEPVAEVADPEVAESEAAGSQVADSESAEAETAARDALDALLHRIDSTVDEEDPQVPVENHDGLADRGPWTENELASLDHTGGWYEESNGSGSVVSDDVPTSNDDEPAPSAESAPEAEDAEQVEESEEPINRGLLLKFLSSVRS